jgi:hypothetical protein
MAKKNAIVLISKRAKAIQRESPNKSWKACIKQASAEYRSNKKVGAKKSKSKKKTKFRQTGTSNKKNDRERKARPPGPRIPKGGKKVTYTERRKNRSDVPGSLTGTALNEMVLRNLRERNNNLQEVESKIIRIKKSIKDHKPGMAKNLLKVQLKNLQKYQRTIKTEIRILKTNIK